MYLSITALAVIGLITLRNDIMYSKYTSIPASIESAFRIEKRMKQVKILRQNKK